jgi:hypothetical protein
VGGPAVLVGCGDDAPNAGGPTTSAPTPDGTVRGTAASPPPPVDRSQAHLWLGAEVVPPGGGDLPVVLVDPTSGGDTWGVAAEVDWWDGSGWVRVDAARVCMDFWGCVGQIGGVDAVEAIGLSAAPVGPLTWIGADGLDPGWYRLTQTSNEGTVAAGQFEVRPGAATVPAAEHEEGALLVGRAAQRRACAGAPAAFDLGAHRPEPAAGDRRARDVGPRGRAAGVAGRPRPDRALGRWELGRRVRLEHGRRQPRDRSRRSGRADPR